MTMQAQVEVATGHILAIGKFPAGSPDPETIEIVSLTPKQEATVHADERGQRMIGPDGAVTIIPRPPDLLAEERQRRAEAFEKAVEAGDVLEVGRLIAAQLQGL